MKLLTKNSLNLLSLTLFVFLFGIFGFYSLLRSEMNRSINKELDKRESSIIKQINQDRLLKNILPGENENIIITAIKNESVPAPAYYDTLLYDNSIKKLMAYRQHNFVLELGNQKYQIRIFKSLEETDTLIIRIFLITAFLLITMISSLILINRYSSGQIWKDFYDTIKKINNYDINSQEHFKLSQSDIDEFEDMNKVLVKMIDRIKLNYFNMKEYAENASHEIQTPLAIINARMELLLQSGNLNKNQLKSIHDAYEASNRLSRVNKTLLLLAKIENRQFPESEMVSPAKIINKQMEVLDDLILSKKLKISTQFNDDVLIKMNPYLAEVLFSNLIKNAIRHNIQGGKIFISFTGSSFLISNSGSELKGNPDDIFKRFYKNSSSSESLGLGLAIVQKICEAYNFNLQYNYLNNLHCINVGLATNQS